MMLNLDVWCIRMLSADCTLGFKWDLTCMGERMLSNVRSGFLKRAELFKLRLKAMRSGVWFRGLSRLDRVLVDLTIRVAGRVRSFVLARNILAVVRKLESVMESRFLRAVREVGLPLARKLSSIAQGWGNKTAEDWVSDKGFETYLAAIFFNVPRLFGGPP
jgi:hypothetical protein